MANARNGERFLTGMANAYGQIGENAIIVCYDLKYKMRYKVYVLLQLYLDRYIIFIIITCVTSDELTFPYFCMCTS